MGDSEIDHSKNLSEINEKLEANTKKIDRLERLLEVYQKENDIDLNILKYLCNFIANIVYSSNGNVAVNNIDIFDGLFRQYDLYSKISKMLYGNAES